MKGIEKGPAVGQKFGRGLGIGSANASGFEPVEVDEPLSPGTESAVSPGAEGKLQDLHAMVMELEASAVAPDDDCLGVSGQLPAQEHGVNLAAGDVDASGLGTVVQAPQRTMQGQHPLREARQVYNAAASSSDTLNTAQAPVLYSIVPTYPQGGAMYVRSGTHAQPIQVSPPQQSALQAPSICNELPAPAQDTHVQHSADDSLHHAPQAGHLPALREGASSHSPSASTHMPTRPRGRRELHCPTSSSELSHQPGNSGELPLSLALASQRHGQAELQPGIADTVAAHGLSKQQGPQHTSGSSQNAQCSASQTASDHLPQQQQAVPASAALHTLHEPDGQAAAQASAAAAGQGRALSGLAIDDFEEEEDPQLVLLESMRVLEAIEGLIRTQLHLPPGAPLPAQLPRAGTHAHSGSGPPVSPELLDALEGTLLVICSAREDIALLQERRHSHRHSSNHSHSSSLYREDSSYSRTSSHSHASHPVSHSSRAAANTPSQRRLSSGSGVQTASPYLGNYSISGRGQPGHRQDVYASPPDRPSGPARVAGSSLRPASGSYGQSPVVAGQPGGYRSSGPSPSIPRRPSSGHSPSYSEGRAATTGSATATEPPRISPSPAHARGSPSAAAVNTSTPTRSQARRNPNSMVQLEPDLSQQSLHSRHSRAWHKEAPPEDWLAEKVARREAERRKREQQVAADMRFLAEVREKVAHMQAEHENLLNEAESITQAARSAKLATETQHKWLAYQDAILGQAQRH